MSSETEQLIRELADKFGTTAEHLWGVLIYQAHVNGIVLSICLGLILAVIFSLNVAAYKLTTGDDPAIYNDVEFVWAASAVISVFLLFFVPFLASEIATSFLNPEYWALRKLLP